jgi:hypothetical protein
MEFGSVCIIVQDEEFSHIPSSTKQFIAVFEVFTAVVLKISLFWDLALHNSVKIN